MFAYTKSKIWQLLLVAFFFVLPFERIPTVDVSGYTIKISYILALVMIILLFFSRPSRLFEKTPISKSDWFLVAFFCLSAISTVAYSLVAHSIIILLLWAFMVILYLILSRVITNTATIKTIEDSILLATLLICIFGIFQFVGDSVGLSQSVTGLRIQYTKIVMDFPRVQSVALEPLYFANFLFIPLFISVKRYLLSGKAFGKYFWLTFLITLSITLTVSRGAFLALAITFLFLLIYLLYTKNGGLLQRYTKLLISVAASIIVALILIFVFDGKQALQIFFGHSVVTNIQADASSYNRISAYKQSIDVFKLHPVLGNGVASFGIVTTPQADIAKTGYATVNNEYLEILAETGILGFLLFVLFIIFYFKEIYSRSKFKKESTKTGLFIGCLAVVAILIQYNFFSTFYIIYIWAFLALIKSNSLAESNL